MARYCRYCGGVVDENTGVCTKCHKQVVVQRPVNPSMQGQTIVNLSKKELKKLEKQRQKQIDEQRKQNEKDARPIGKKISSYFLQMFGLIFVLSILALGIIGTLQYYGIINIPALGNVMDKLNIVRNVEKEDEIVEDDEEDYVVENENNIHSSNNNVTLEEVVFDENHPYYVVAPDPDEYFDSIGDIKSDFAYKDSKEIEDVNACLTNLRNRGFDSDIYSDYSDAGEYIGETKLSQESNSIYPEYHTYYISGNNILWKIEEQNGQIVACPISLIISNQLNDLVYLAESDSITAYSASSQKYYIYVPYESTARIKVVDRIDKELLESISLGDLQ